ncbi:TRAP transporter 4TM/12TM fusion protein [Stella humosa]|uniref:TRAP transporter 4TM/12TM fusion protein n=1 Tax=Stella humosa TaxID=94 RepID=A0A3N1MF21_9PROT|nr:TRAP transporter fused permease subunit [Stella humosa]ROQ01297.1 TRAP transporter 4TM/12TM fusion protein [Stella humosa]BBK31671.1 C4-dicarboxylate ABC transporter permease [Stella humosa]
MANRDVNEPVVAVEPVVDEAALKKAEEFIEQEEGATNRLGGWVGHALTALAVIMSLFHLWAAYDIVPTTILRPVHVGFALVLIFLLFPIVPRFRNRIQPWDLLFAAVSIATIWYLIQGGDDLTDRASLPNSTDQIFGVIFILLVLEATRRSTGWIMPAVAVGFIVYALVGPSLPAPWTHRGYPIDRLTGQLYMTLEGIFGTAVDVSSSLIILFTIFGAVLQFSGAGKFFIDFSFSLMGGRPTSAGRAVVLSSFLLGGPSGSGVATTVTLGSVAYPMLARAGYGRNDAGGLLAAGGLGAILSPPVLGAAAFLIAEFLKISYLDVIRMAIIPTCLYYMALFVMVELDGRRFGMNQVTLVDQQSLWQLTRQYWFHFTSLVSIIVFMLWGFSPVLAVFWSTILAALVSFMRRETALTPPRLIQALAAGSVGMLNVAATCAAAGIIVGVVTLTGLGLKFSAIAIEMAGGSLALTALFTALIVWIVGLAVPVTASYIICAVIAAPALTKLGVPDYAAHMFIFYYAVLSEVSPPTALSPFAAAAITGGNPYKTTLQAWKYTMPAFVVPFVFVLDPLGVGLLLDVAKAGGWLDTAWITLTTTVGVGILAAASQRWLVRRMTLLELGVAILAGALLLFPSLIAAIVEDSFALPLGDVKGLGLAVTAGLFVLQWMTRRRAA